MNHQYSPYYYDDGSEPKKEEKYCKFIMKTGVFCGKEVTGDHDYCMEHYKTPCVVCHYQATHVCYEFLCKEKLCDNSFCRASHNIKNHINLKYMGAYYGE